MVNRSRTLVLALGCVTACGPKRGVATPPAEPARHAAAVGAGTDWGALLFPPGAVATAARPSAPVTAPEMPVSPPPVFGLSDVAVSDDSLDVELSDLAAFCKAQVGCFEMPLPVKFSPNATFRGLHAVRVNAESYSYSTLLVELATGVAPLQVAYDVRDPNDPGCPAIVRNIGIERVSIENGLLVVVALGVTTTWTDPAPNDTDGGARDVLVPVVSIAKAEGKRLHQRHFQSWGGPELGSIVQPSSHFVPWHKLAWKNRKTFWIAPDGTMRRQSET